MVSGCITTTATIIVVVVVIAVNISSKYKIGGKKPHSSHHTLQHLRQRHIHNALTALPAQPTSLSSLLLDHHLHSANGYFQPTHMAS